MGVGPAELRIAVDEIAYLAEGKRWRRFWRKPADYLAAICYRALIYPRSRKPRAVTTDLAWGEPLDILLPASTDIYLTGGKSHDSEIRLARLLIATLQPGDVFVDVGAHYGYFSALAAVLVGDQGQVIAVEAAPATFSVLARNASTRPQMTAHHVALSETRGVRTFYEFPHAYAEYNSFDIEQYAGQAWFEAQAPQAIRVETQTLDGLLLGKEISRSPRVIKIDVEGGEADVLRGASTTLAAGSAPLIVMEYLSPERHNAPHRAAESLLRESGYRPYAIGTDGRLTELDDVAIHFRRRQIDSDNIAFQRS